jgi:hypothetical protein
MFGELLMFFTILWSLLAFLFLSSIPAHAEWRPISYAEGAGGFMIYVDPATVRRTAPPPSRSLKNGPPSCEASMSFSIRPYRRFPVYCHVAYHADLSEGHGTIWNVSLNGWRLSGDLPLRIGKSFPITVTLPNQERVFVAAGIVRWVRGDDYGVETLVANNAALNQMARFVTQQVENESTQLNGGYYGRNTPEVDSFSRSARLTTRRPPDPDTA